MRDACDPDTFNAAVGKGTCVSGAHGTTKFNLFVAELQQDQIAGAWRFNPLLKTTPGTFRLATVKLDSGRKLSLKNFGGEVHTFTKVARYNGGFIAFLNQLSGNPEAAPECLMPENSTNIFCRSWHHGNRTHRGIGTASRGRHSLAVLYPPVDANGYSGSLSRS
jgi:hypothetical protein